MTASAIAEPPKPSVRIWSDRPLRHSSSAVRRPSLVRRLADPAAPPLAALVAPAGYGKTTLLREWARRDARPFAWVTAGERHNDGDSLREAVALAIQRAGAAEPRTPFVLVVDDAHALHRRAGLDALATVAQEVPPHGRLAVASRRELPLPVARMRVQRLVTEIGARELAMSRPEASRLLLDAGHRLDRETLDALVRHTEGWPVALVLATLYLSDRGGRPSLAHFSGADRLVADYVCDEVLGELPDDVRSFATRTSLADTLTGSLCDALLCRDDSAAVLERLARDGLVIPVDRTGERFRYHRLVRETLRTELARRDPPLEAALHRRASGWYRAEGDVDRAVFHALAAGDARVAGDLVWRQLPAELAGARTTMLERWLSRFGERQVARQPRLALAAAGCELVRGQGHSVRHWASMAADAPRPSESRGTVEAGVLLLHAAIGADGPARMRDDARAARSAMHPHSRTGAAFASFLEGVAHQLLGDAGAATGRLEACARDAAIRAPHLHALCLSELAALALDRADWEELIELAARARAQADRLGLREAPACAVVFAISALARAHRGRTEEARADLLDATRLTGMLTDFAPWYAAQVHILLARTAVRLSDVRLGRAHAAEAERLARRVPAAVGLARRLAAAMEQLEAFTPARDQQPRPMTAAELRVLRYLPTHLSFREIAEMTHVSANTVKTQANAVYRKFGVACRSDAVARARSCGLLD